MITLQGTKSVPLQSMGGAATAFLALAACIATSTSYAVQPELEGIADDLHTSLSVVSAAAAAPILGYLIGLALLVPLVDHIRPSRLLASQLSMLGVGLVAAASAPTAAVLGIGLFVSGVCASTGAQMSTLAAKHSAPQNRGRALGTVTAGISAGILLGRILGGALADWLGWRPMLLTFAAACFVLAVAAVFTLPRTISASPQAYLSTIRALPGLLKSQRTLQLAAISGALWFFSFSLIWVSLSIALSLPPLDLPPRTVGLYALAGLLGIAATRVAGSLADRYGNGRVVLAGLGLSLVSAVSMVFALDVPVVLVAALALFDVGLFAAQVANQSRVVSLDPARPARFNSAYMVAYFVGGSIGTGLGGSIVTRFGWPTAATLAAATIALAFVIVLTTAERAPRSATNVRGLLHESAID